MRWCAPQWGQTFWFFSRSARYKTVSHAGHFDHNPSGIWWRAVDSALRISRDGIILSSQDMREWKGLGSLGDCECSITQPLASFVRIAALASERDYDDQCSLLTSMAEGACSVFLKPVCDCSQFLLRAAFLHWVHVLVKILCLHPAKAAQLGYERIRWPKRPCR